MPPGSVATAGPGLARGRSLRTGAWRCAFSVSAESDGGYCVKLATRYPTAGRRSPTGAYKPSLPSIALRDPRPARPRSPTAIAAACGQGACFYDVPSPQHLVIRRRESAELRAASGAPLGRHAVIQAGNAMADKTAVEGSFCCPGCPFSQRCAFCQLRRCRNALVS